MAWIDIKGHRKVIDFLLIAKSKKRLAHSLLFLGSEGVGKKKVALEFAKFLLCQDPQEEGACEHCISCRQCNLGSHPDLHMLTHGAMDWIKIDQVRQFQSQMYLSAYNSKYKVFLIDNAHMLTQEAANSLLKMIEEPTKGTIIILITNKIDSCPATIVSRCQRLYFSPLTEEDIVESLQGKLEKSKADVRILSRFAQGSLGVALALSEQKDAQYNIERTLEVFLSPRRQETTMFLADMDRYKAQIAIDTLLNFFRDLLLLKIGLNEHLFLSDAQDNKSALLSKNMDIPDIEECLKALFKAYELNKANTNPKILLTWLTGQLQQRIGV
jgi:DNA polymerase-3 subunit delta'